MPSKKKDAPGAAAQTGPIISEPAPSQADLLIEERGDETFNAMKELLTSSRKSNEAWPRTILSEEELVTFELDQFFENMLLFGNPNMDAIRAMHIWGRPAVGGKAREQVVEIAKAAGRRRDGMMGMGYRDQGRPGPS